MTGYVRKFEVNTTISFKISDKQLLKKINQIWKRVEKLLKIEFDSEPVYGDNEKYIITNTTTTARLHIFIAKECQKKKNHASLYQ